MSAHVVATLQKNAIEEVHVTLDEYNGAQLIDIRVFTQYRTTGEIGPTKKGVSLKLELLPQLVEALRQAETKARSQGLL